MGFHNPTAPSGRAWVDQGWDQGEGSGGTVLKRPSLSEVQDDPSPGTGVD